MLHDREAAVMNGPEGMASVSVPANGIARVEIAVVARRLPER